MLTLTEATAREKGARRTSQGIKSRIRTAFLSHASADAGLAAELCRLLEAKDVSCWIAPRDVEPGRPYGDECVRGIEDSAAFVLLATPASVRSVQVLAEVEQAHKRGKPIYSILVGKPRISRELDYYISRLHWVELAGNSTSDLANRLSDVLLHRREWSEVAAPPSLRRTIRYRRDAFIGSLLATTLALTAAGGLGAFWLHSHAKRISEDFRSLGWVTVSAAEAQAAGAPILLHAQVWLGVKDTAFKDVGLSAAFRGQSQAVSRKYLSAQFDPARVSDVQTIDFEAPRDANRMVTCMSVPSADLGARYRVKQEFLLNSTALGRVRVVPTAPVVVSKEDGSPCTPSS